MNQSDYNVFGPSFDVLPVKRTFLNKNYRLLSVLRRTPCTVQYLAATGFHLYKVTEVYTPSCRRDMDLSVWSYENEEFQEAIRDFDSHRRRHETLQLPSGSDALVSLVDSFEENGTLYIVTSLPQGEPLLQYVWRKTVWRRTVKECLVKLLADLMGAVELGSDLSGLHCSPDTVFVALNPLSSWECHLILTDFYGEPRLPDNTTAAPPPLSPYEPIEWFTSRQETDQRTVIYRLCAMCYYFLRKQDPQSAIDRLFDDQTFFFVQLDDPDAPFWAVMKKGMAVKPGDRYQTFREFYEALTCLR